MWKVCKKRRIFRILDRDIKFGILLGKIIICFFKIDLVFFILFKKVNIYYFYIIVG